MSKKLGIDNSTMLGIKLEVNELIVSKFTGC
jgi:hypothetical protein